jgi:hypothetical protein
MTPFEEGEDDEDIIAIRNPEALVTPDTSLVTPNPPRVTHQESSTQSVMQDQALDAQVQMNEGPVTRNRAKKLQQEVHAFLSELRCNTNESHILSKSCTLLLLRFTQEVSPLGYVKDAEGYIEDPKTAVQAGKGYAHKTQDYTAKASTSCPSLYHLGKRQGSSHTCRKES